MAKTLSYSFDSSRFDDGFIETFNNSILVATYIFPAVSGSWPITATLYNSAGTVEFGTGGVITVTYADSSVECYQGVYGASSGDNLATVAVVTTLAAPTLTALNDDHDSVTVNFASVANASSYTLQWTSAVTEGVPNWDTPSERENVTSGTSIGGLIPDTAYCFRLKAVGDGQNYITSDWSNVILTLTDPWYPPALSPPNGPLLSSKGMNKIFLSYSTVENAARYTLQYSTDSTFANPTEIASFSSGAAITGLVPSTSYYFRLKAVGDGQTYSDSEFGSVVTIATEAAGDLVVQNNNDSGGGSLRQAIADAQSGETILFGDSFLLPDRSIILLSSLTITKSIIIDARNLPSKPILNADGANFPLFLVDMVVTTDRVTVAGLKLTGVIGTSNGSSSLEDLVAVVRGKTGRMTFSDCYFTGNNSDYIVLAIAPGHSMNTDFAPGWGVEMDDELINCRFIGNVLIQGGITNTHNRLLLRQSLLADNTGSGAGLQSYQMYSHSILFILNSIITHATGPSFSTTSNTSAQLYRFANSFFSTDNTDNSGHGYSCQSSVFGTVAATSSWFVNRSEGNYHPAATSCVLGAADNSLIDWDTDLDGNDRCQGTNSDIGCYEYQPSNTLSAPTLLSAVADGETKVNVTFTGDENASLFRLEYSTDSGFTDAMAFVPFVSGTSVTGLTPGTTYYFRIRALGDGSTYSNSDWSLTANTTTEVTRSLLDTPQNLAVTAVTSSEIFLSWSAVSNADGYLVRYFSSGAPDDYRFASFDAGVESGLLSGLDAGSTVSSQIKANGSGLYRDSDWSDSVSAVLPTAPSADGPIITILGQLRVSIAVGSRYIDPGATAVDRYGRSLEVTTIGTVNTLVAGSYPIRYSATDAFGESAIASRVVYVVSVAGSDRKPVWSVVLGVY